jgi:hypothetical protein
VNFKHVLVAVAGLCAGILTTAFADLPPPIWAVSFPNGFEKSKAPLSHGFHMGTFDVQFEKTTLIDVQQVIDAGKIAFQGDAGNAHSWLCYTFSDSKKTGRIWLVADSEMEGIKVSSIQVTLEPSAVATADCPALPEKFQPMSFDHDIWLGMKGADASKALGDGSLKQGKWVIYGYLGKLRDQKGCEPDGYDLSNFLMFEVSGGAVQSIEAGQITSC